MANTRDTVRFNFSVPSADTSVLQWLATQDNKSVSVRAIIRDYIKRHGYTDAFCLPVEQEPRRGRPPGVSSRREDESSMGDSDAYGDDDLVEEVSISTPVRRTRVTAPTQERVESDPTERLDAHEEGSSAVSEERFEPATSSSGDDLADPLTSLRDASSDDGMQDVLSSLRD